MTVFIVTEELMLFLSRKVNVFRVYTVGGIILKHAIIEEFILLHKAIWLFLIIHIIVLFGKDKIILYFMSILNSRDWYKRNKKICEVALEN